MMGSYWVLIKEGMWFLMLCVVSIVLLCGFVSLIDIVYCRWVGDDEMIVIIIDLWVYWLWLSMMFGIDLSVDEVVVLGLFI